MANNQNIFYKKKILIYGLGKSGLSASKFLKKNNQVITYDDKRKNGIKKIKADKFDYIIISPGIDINKCSLSKFLKSNTKKIYTDLDVFYNHYEKNNKITITGTNGKSTTAQILYEILKNQKIDARLVGNIGNPILLEKNVKINTVFVIEASSYQLDYSKIFRTNVAAIINISADHLERHKTLKQYIKAKFRLIKSQTKKDYAILNVNNFYIKKQVRNQNFLPKIIKVSKQVNSSFLKKINNPYFMTEGNKENLLFVIAISKIFKIKDKILLKILNNFIGLQYRQQIIFKSKNLTIINDSKATTFSSSVSILKSISNVYWVVGGLAKQGDKFLMSKTNNRNVKAYIFGKNKSFFVKKLRNKMRFETFINLKFLVKKIFLDIKNDKNQKHKTILFSPAAASFDSFKNFEERGKYFNNLIKKAFNVR